MKITFGEMRSMGLRGVLVYCHCGRHIAMELTAGPTKCGCPTSRRGLCVRAAVASAPTSGLTSIEATHGLRSRAIECDSCHP